MDNLLEDDASIAALVRSLRRVAVLGIKTDAQSGEASFYVPKYLADQGIEIVPVPVYFPEVTTILGRPVVRRVQDAGAVDLVDVFRRPKDLPQHLDDLLAAKPPAVWFQLGIRNDAVAKTLAAAGIKVVQDRCLMVEHRRWAVTS